MKLNKNHMIIILAVAAVAVWYFFIRKKPLDLPADSDIEPLEKEVIEDMRSHIPEKDLHWLDELYHKRRSTVDYYKVNGQINEVGKYLATFDASNPNKEKGKYHYNGVMNLWSKNLHSKLHEIFQKYKQEAFSI